MRECENSLRRLQHRLPRPVPGAPSGSEHRHRRDPRRAQRPRAPGQGPLPRQLDVARRRRSSRRSGSPSGATASGSCASSRRTRSSCAASRPTCCRRASATAWPSSRGARSPVAGCRGSGARAATPFTSHRANRIPARYDLDEPGNQQKLDAADALGQLADDAGIPLVHLAVAWVLRNPAVTSAIIGPRTMEQLTTQLGAADVDLDDDVLDRIDEIVPPGTNFTWADAGYSPPMIADARAADGPDDRRPRRRRPRWSRSSRRAGTSSATAAPPAPRVASYEHHNPATGVLQAERAARRLRPRSTTRSPSRATRARRGVRCRCPSAWRSCTASPTCSTRTTTKRARSTRSTTARR